MYAIHNMSNLIFYVQDECTKMYAIDNVSLAYSYVQLDFYVQDGSTKCKLYVTLALPILMSNMTFYVKDDSTKGNNMFDMVYIFI